MTARRILRRHGEQKASAAAEVMRSSRTFSIEGLLFDASFLCSITCRRKSGFPTTQRRWPISGWPPSIHFLWKRLSYHSPLPSPAGGLDDSSNPSQSPRLQSMKVARGCALRVTSCRRIDRGILRRRRRWLSARSIRPPSTAAVRWPAGPLGSCVAADPQSADDWSGSTGRCCPACR